MTRLMDLAANPEAAPEVRAAATAALRGLHKSIGAKLTPGAADEHLEATRDDIERFLSRPHEPRRRTQPLPRPPGDPIGAAQPAP